jgi:hypothetical protein
MPRLRGHDTEGMVAAVPARIFPIYNVKHRRSTALMLRSSVVQQSPVILRCSPMKSASLEGRGHPSRLLPTWTLKEVRNRQNRFRSVPRPLILRGSLRSHLRMTGNERNSSRSRDAIRIRVVVQELISSLSAPIFVRECQRWPSASSRSVLQAVPRTKRTNGRKQGSGTPGDA